MSYVLVMTLGVTDRDLLLDEKQVSVPLLSLGLRPSVWFCVLPLLLTIFHVDLLINLREHVQKLIRLRRAAATSGHQIDSRDAQPFLLDFAFVHSGRGFWGKALWTIVWITVGCTGVVTLLVVQIRFSGYQSIAISSFHALLVLIDLIVAGTFLREFKRDALQPIGNGPLGLRISVSPLADIFGVACMFICALSLGLTVAFASAFGVFEKELLEMVVRGREGQPRSQSERVRMWWQSVWSHPIVPEAILPRLIVTDQVLSKDSADERNLLDKWQLPRLVEQTANRQAYRFGSLGYTAQNFQTRVDLRDRNFNFAKLSRNFFAGCDMSGSSLRRADLSDSFFDGSKFDGAKLSGADFTKSSLVGASFKTTYSYAVNFSGSVAAYASFVGSKLQLSNFRGGALLSTDLRYTELDGADFSGTALQGANLAGARMLGLRCAGTWPDSVCTEQLAVGSYSKEDLKYLVFSNRAILGSENRELGQRTNVDYTLCGTLDRKTRIVDLNTVVNRDGILLRLPTEGEDRAAYEQQLSACRWKRGRVQNAKEGTLVD